MRVAILTISDAGARGERADTSGDAIEAWARARGYEVAARALVPDETARHRLGAHGVVRRATPPTSCSPPAARGSSARDVTPEATRAVLEREAPGIAERIRVAVDRRRSRARRCRAASRHA